MSKYDELVERLNARIEKQRSEHGNYFYNGVVDPELAKAAAAIITLEAELAEAQQQVKGALIMHEALSEKLEITQDELAAMNQKRLCDHGRLLFRDDVERHCANPDICFEYGGTVRCSPCAIKQADAEGIETLDIERVYLPEVARLNRELAATKARGDRLAEALTNINRKASPDPERTMSEASNDLYWCACEARQALTEWRDQ